MTNTREPDPSAAGTLRTQTGWLLVLLVAGGGIVLAIVEVGLWLVFASGVVASFAVVGLVRPASDSSSTVFVRHAETGWAYLRTELARSRRHDRRFTVVAIPGDLWAPRESRGDDLTRRALEVAMDVQTQVRRPDRAWVDGARLHLLLTDCDRQQGLAFLARARLSMPQLFADDRVRLAVFPDDGITSGALMAALEPRDARAIEPETTGGVAAP